MTGLNVTELSSTRVTICESIRDTISCHNPGKNGLLHQQEQTGKIDWKLLSKEGTSKQTKAFQEKRVRH